MGRRFLVEPARRSHGNRARNASARSSAPISSRRVFPTRKGASQSGVVGEPPVRQVRPGSPSARRRNSDAVAPLPERLAPGQARQRRARETPRASASALSRPAERGSVCSARTSAPSRRRRRALSEAEARSKASSSTVSIAAPADRLDVLETSAAPRAGCAPTPPGPRPRRSRETARPPARRAARAPPPARSPSGTRRACRAPWRSGRDRRRREKGAGGSALGPLSGRASPSKRERGSSRSPSGQRGRA